VSGESNHFLNPERESHTNVRNVSLPFRRESTSLTELSDAQALTCVHIAKEIQAAYSHY